MEVLIKLALGWAWPRWAARLFGWVMPLLVVAALSGAVVALIYRRGETAGGTVARAAAETAHVQTITEARSDERHAAAVADAISRRVAIADNQTTTLVRSKMTEIHDDLATPTHARAGGIAPRLFDTGGVRASLNALVDRANGAADAADAER